VTERASEDEYASLPQSDPDTHAVTDDAWEVEDTERDAHSTRSADAFSEPNTADLPPRSKQEIAPSFPDYKPAGDFPIDALPETIQAAVREACKNDHVPGPIAVQSALSVVSLVCQDFIWIERRPGVRSVASLFMLAVAGSGVRKSQVDGAFLEQIHAFDREKDAEYKKAQENYESIRQAKKFEVHVLQMKLKNLLLKSIPIDDKNHPMWEADCKATAEELKKAKVQPEKPRLKRLLYSQIAPATLERRLCENWPAAGLFSNEAGDILNARRPEELSQLDRLWEGQPIDVERSNDKESVSVPDPRVTMSLMIQPSVFERFLERKGAQARGIGFLARLLICQPASLFGKRLIDPAEQRSTYWIGKYSDRISALFKMMRSEAARDESERIVMRFTPRAQQIWIDDYNENEKKMGDGGDFFYETDFASRYSEHVARLAALFYFFEEWDGDKSVTELLIPYNYVEQAIRVGQWYGQQFRCIFDPRLILEKNAQLVREKLFQIFHENWPIVINGEVVAGEFMKRIPAHLRKASDFEPVKRWLEENKIIRFYKKTFAPYREYVRFDSDSPEHKKLNSGPRPRMTSK